MNHPVYDKVQQVIARFYICGDYDPKTGLVGQLFFVLPIHVELIGNYKSGDTIIVSGKEYVLGERQFDKNSTITTYELIKRSPVLGLPLDL